MLIHVCCPSWLFYPAIAKWFDNFCPLNGSKKLLEVKYRIRTALDMVSVVLRDQMCAALGSSFDEKVVLELSSTSERGLFLLIYFSELAKTQISLKLFELSAFILLAICYIQAFKAFFFLPFFFPSHFSAFCSWMVAPLVDCHWTVATCFWCWYVGVQCDIWVPSEHDEIINDILHNISHWN